MYLHSPLGIFLWFRDSDVICQKSQGMTDNSRSFTAEANIPGKVKKQENLDQSTENKKNLIWVQ